MHNVCSKIKVSLIGNKYSALFLAYLKQIFRHELQNILSGNGQVRHGATIQSAAAYLRRKKETVSVPSKPKFVKEQEIEILIPYIQENELWISGISRDKYIGEGAEQKIFESSAPEYILKLNDSVFYESWGDYFTSLLLHNFFFPHLAYDLVGFTNHEGVFHAVVKQPFVRATSNTNLEHVADQRWGIAIY